MKVSILIKVSKVAESKIEDHKERQPHNVKKRNKNIRSISWEIKYKCYNIIKSTTVRGLLKRNTLNTVASQLWG